MWIVQARYKYYQHGPLKRVELAEDLQGIDYVYTINGWLKSINEPDLNQADYGKDGVSGSPNSNFARDLFGMSLHYFSGDYMRIFPGNSMQQTATSLLPSLLEFDVTASSEVFPEQFNGNIWFQRWNTRNNNVGKYPNQQLSYFYRYDKKNQLLSAQFQAVNPYISYQNPLSEYKVSNISYDANGNLMTLSRSAYSRVDNATNTVIPETMDHFTYNYSTSAGKRINNKLGHVSDAVTHSTGFSDLRPQSAGNYTYDQRGQLTRDNSENNKIEYDYLGNVLRVKTLADQLKVSYSYDEAGQRVKKSLYDNGVLKKEVWYLRNTDGTVLSMYAKNDNDNAVIQEELPLYALYRIGIYNKRDQTYTYEVSDHLGNVRATFRKALQTELYNSFEGNGQDEIRWQPTNNTSFDEARTGALSLKLQAPGATTGPYIEIPVKNGYEANVKIYYKFNGPLPDASIRYELVNHSGNLIAGSSMTYNIIHPAFGTNSWVEHNSAYVVNHTLPNLRLRIYCQNLSPEPMYFDDMFIAITSPDYLGGFTFAELESSTDYYPFGMEMPGRTYNAFTGSSGYRYTYQGQYAEKDALTGWNEFELRNWDGRLGRWTSPDPYGQYHSSYLGMGNNPVSTVDPDGGFVHWVVPVAIGATAGAVTGGIIAHNNGQEFWKGAIVGGIFGAGIGLGVSAGLAAAGTNITGLSVGGAGFAKSGATTTLWNISSNALTTGSINALSTGFQTDWDTDAMYKSGIVGVVSGGIGGAVASLPRYTSAAHRGAMSVKGIRTQNYVTNILSGAGDRMVRSVDAGLSTGDIIKNTALGGVEGAIAARMFSSDKFLNFGSNIYGNPITGRYLSGFLSNSMTSNPGASLMAARIYGSLYPTWMFGQMNDDLSISISTSLTISPFIYVGLSRMQIKVVGSKYPYAYDFLDPNYWK